MEHRDLDPPLANKAVLVYQELQDQVEYFEACDPKYWRAIVFDSQTQYIAMTPFMLLEIVCASVVDLLDKSGVGTLLQKIETVDNALVYINGRLAYIVLLTSISGVT